jgi:signal transduction histidine kinase
MKFLRSIKVRITLWYVLIAAVLVTFSGLTAYIQLTRGLTLKTVYPWHMRSTIIEKTGDNVSIGRFTDVFTGTSNTRGYKSEYGYDMAELTRLAAEGKQVELGTLEGPVFIDAGLLADTSIPEGAEIWLYLYGSADQPGVYQLVQVNQTAMAMEARLDYFRKTVLITAGLTLALAAVLGFFIIWRLLKPLYIINRTARDIDGRQMGRRLKVETGDEFGELAANLNRMFDRLETAVNTERKVASDLSHELRTPLAVMQSEATRALKKEPGDEAYQRALETVNREITHVAAVAERLLFLARSEHHNEMVMGEVDLKALMTEIGWDTEVLCEEKSLTFHADIPETARDFHIRGDQVRLRECFLNLAGNAVRYTPAGGAVTLSLSQQDGCYLAAVSDTGTGIPAQHLPHIFERFYRVEQEGTEKDGGAGLGLAICKRIAELHGGRITVESKPGRGSKFTVYLPGKAVSQS